ncbi:MAG TPA: hypothetical protein VNF06_00755 [Candidatus Aquilonibacter sp.]|nr:hypothetical protein [Candidatus Aquilonibacter sp.]
MAPRSKGLFSARTRHLARHHKPNKLGLTTLIKDFHVGDMVAIVPKGSFKDIPHPRYRGKIGKIIEKRGTAYVVRIPVSKSTIRKIIVPQRHLEKPAAK